MSRRRALQIGALVWAGVGAAVALVSLGGVNEDARILVGSASVVGPLAAVAGACSLRRNADRLAGAALLVSVLTPTYFAYPLNVPALLVGLALVAVPNAVLPDEPDDGSPNVGSSASAVGL